MKLFRKNFRMIIGFLVGVILASCVTVYAYSYVASDVKYTRNGTEISVQDALNDLYSKKSQLNYLTGTMVADGSNLSLNYESDFDGKILVVMTHVINGTNNSYVKLNNNNVDLVVTNHVDNYRKIEYAIIDVSEGDRIDCFTNSSSYNGAELVWSYSSCSLYGVE